VIVASGLVGKLFVAEGHQRADRVRLERNRHKGLTLGRRMPGPGELQPLVRHHLAIDATDLMIFAALCIGEADAVSAAAPCVEIGLQRARSGLSLREPLH
jgi:hypothetical protein